MACIERALSIIVLTVSNNYHYILLASIPFVATLVSPLKAKSASDVNLSTYVIPHNEIAILHGLCGIRVVVFVAIRFSYKNVVGALIYKSNDARVIYSLKLF